MIIKYEKHELVDDEFIVGAKVTNITEVAKKDATHIHYCGHDTNPPTACRLEPIK